MLNMKTLDTVIALIVVILMLSLIVQSVQSLLKKWFKLKSETILKSLDDLFKYADSEKLAGIASDKLVEALKVELVKLGRTTSDGRAAIDSIAKEDLLKILTKIKFPGAEDSVAKFQEQVHTWYDTAMQSFEERHTRRMKTYSLVVSIFVVIILNANFFDIYKNISTNDAMRGSIISKRADVETRLQAAGAQTEVEAGDLEQRRIALEKERAALDELLAQNPVFGFTPLEVSDVSDFFHARNYWSANADKRIAYALQLVAGWAIMVMLLSIGAPFWQDALESLFGVKNLLRKRTDTKNTEQQSGEGQTKP
jgi:hypothetical protein